MRSITHLFLCLNELVASLLDTFLEDFDIRRNPQLAHQRGGFLAGVAVGHDALVLLANEGLGPDEVLQELGRRFGVSGLDEKASRKA